MCMPTLPARCSILYVMCVFEHAYYVCYVCMDGCMLYAAIFIRVRNTTARASRKTAEIGKLQETSNPATAPQTTLRIHHPARASSSPRSARDKTAGGGGMVFSRWGIA